MTHLLLSDIIALLPDLIFKAGVPLLLFFLGYHFGFRKWLREKETEQRLARDQMRYQSRLEAYRAAWALLAYMSEKENDRTIFVTRLADENQPDQGTACYLRTAQAEAFLKRLPEMFYTEGHGILLDTDTRNRLFEFRGIVYKILDSARQGKEQALPDRIRVQNEDTVKKARKLHETLLVHLRRQLEGS